MLADISDLEILLVFKPDRCELFFRKNALSFIPKLVGLLGDENAALRGVCVGYILDLIRGDRNAFGFAEMFVSFVSSDSEYPGAKGEF